MNFRCSMKGSGGWFVRLQGGLISVSVSGSCAESLVEGRHYKIQFGDHGSMFKIERMIATDAGNGNVYYELSMIQIDVGGGEIISSDFVLGPHELPTLQIGSLYRCRFVSVLIE